MWCVEKVSRLKLYLQRPKWTGRNIHFFFNIHLGIQLTYSKEFSIGLSTSEIPFWYSVKLCYYISFSRSQILTLRWIFDLGNNITRTYVWWVLWRCGVSKKFGEDKDERRGNKFSSGKGKRQTRGHRKFHSLYFWYWNFYLDQSQK